MSEESRPEGASGPAAATPSGTATAHRTDEAFGSERAKAFIDAVVAIALTLLILPLLDAITSEIGAGDGPRPDTASWIGEHFPLLISFVISFVVIAMFWIGHHRTFARVHRVTSPLLWLAMAWLITIVWLPVATALIDEMSDDDVLAKALYIGAMALTSFVELCQLGYLRRHPALHDFDDLALRRSMSVALAMTLLFLLSLLLAALVPAIGYFALFLLALTNPVRLLLGRMLGVPPSADHARSGR